MKLSRRVALNGRFLDDVDDRIVISGIESAEGKENIQAVDTAAGFGQRITKSQRTTLDIAVKFKLLQRSRTPDNMTERSQLLEKVNAWAAPGGWLTVNYRPDRRIQVVLVQAPGEGSLWDYTKEFQMIFRAFTVPYWEEVAQNILSTDGWLNTGSVLMDIGGSAATQCSVELENTSGAAIDACTVNLGGKVMNFDTLGLAGEETLVIDHQDSLVRIWIRNKNGSIRSAMSKRTGANDFLLKPGVYAGSFSARRACRMTVSWRNRYL